ncbi:MAG: Fic family protein [Acidobacteriaceae bacterium]|nr:Fic family protein [Acidobacteriaceae bacterium]
MMTLKQFATGVEAIPASTSWYLSCLGERRGKQDSVTKLSANVLRAMQEHALIESAASSNRIDGVEIAHEPIDMAQVGPLMLRYSNEEAIRRYRYALEVIHQYAAENPVSEELIRIFHQMCSRQIVDVDQYIEKDGDNSQEHPDGWPRKRSRTVSAAKSLESVPQLIRLWQSCIQEQRVHPLLVLAGFNLDFLCTHPFQDANGSVSRLILHLQLEQLGYIVGRFISLERLIEQNKERYLEALVQSSQDYDEGQHDPWPYINYILFILKTAYSELEERTAQVTLPRGAKYNRIIQAISRQAGLFSMADIHNACPEVSKERIRQILVEMKVRQTVVVEGDGRAARWRYLGS